MTTNALQPYQTAIGFLRVPHNIPFEGGELVLLPEYNNHAAYVDARTHQDGFFYPPQFQQYRSDRFDLTLRQSLPEGLETIPNARKPAPTYPLPASHHLNLKNTQYSDNPRLGDAGFILHAVGFAYGVRLQFSDWRFDSRVPILADKLSHITIDDASDFISSAYRKWGKFSPKNQRLILNLLWMATKLESYQYEWEQFLFSYMILDGCYRLAVNEYTIKKNVPHRKRVSILCLHFDIYNDDQHQNAVKKIVDLRNSLFHETLWSDQVMGSPGNRSDIYHTIYLKKLYRRMLAAMLDFKGEFTYSPWISIDKDWFSR